MSDWYGAVVVRLGPILSHPDPTATALEMTRVMQRPGDVEGGIPVVLRKGEFVEGDLVVYAGMDAIVPTTSQRFAFLDLKGKPHRVRARRLRGTFSEGLVTKAEHIGPEEQIQADLVFVEGADLTTRLGVTKHLDEAEREPADYAFDVAEGSSSLTDAILDYACQPENGAAWCWATRDRVDTAMRTGRCSLDGVAVRRPAGIYHAGRVELTLHYGDVKPGSRPGGSVPSSDSESCPRSHLVPKYDLEALRKWGGEVFVAGEPVVAREKIHGANFRAFHDGDRLWVGSRTRWLRRPVDLARCAWWRVAVESGLETKLETCPHYVFYGEMYGQVQDLKYGVPLGGLRLVFFDAMTLIDSPRLTGVFLCEGQLRELTQNLELNLAPLVYEGPWNVEVVAAFRNGPSLVPGADHTREGVVVRPVVERTHPRLGRVVLKVVGEDYKCAADYRDVAASWYRRRRKDDEHARHQDPQRGAPQPRR